MLVRLPARELNAYNPSNMDTILMAGLARNEGGCTRKPKRCICTISVVFCIHDDEEEEVGKWKG
jgi:hypothetical protein